MHSIADFAWMVFWRSGVVAGAALLAVPALRRAPARLRHALLVAALVACAVVPWFRSAAAEPPLLAPEPRAVAPATALLDTAANVIAVLYLLGLAYSGASLLVAARRARALRANTTDPPPAALEALAICSRALGRTAPLRCSSRVTVPVTVGSMILLPTHPLPDDALLPVIGHELAHVRRRDALLHALLKLITLPVAFHPLVRMLERRVAVAREIACDELVVSSLVEPRRYAQTLLSIAERCAAPQPALAFGHADALKLRLLSLRDISAKRRWLGAVGAACVIALIAFTVSRLPWHLFEKRPDLSGTWVLDRAASRFGPMPPYDAFTTTLVQTPTTLASSQTRVRRGRTTRVRFMVVTDGVPRAITIANVHGRGSARWSGSRLITDFTTRQGHWEETCLRLADRNTLIVESVIRESKSGPMRRVFRRLS